MAQRRKGREGGADFKIIGNTSTCFVTVLNKGGVTVFRPKGPAIQIARAIGLFVPAKCGP